jgi:CRISPR-associated protein (TIGR03985 family)
MLPMMLPTVDLLQQLTPGSLKQNLARAVRLWVHLQFLYGEASHSLNLPEWFTYPEWRDAFFTHTHPRTDADPSGHDPQCRCAIALSTWLFENALNLNRSHWIQDLQQRRCCPDNLTQQLKMPLFAVTRRTLVEDFKGLVQCQFLQQEGKRYRRVDCISTTAPPLSNTSSAIVHADLAAIAENLTQQLNGYQRFFLHVDYVVPLSAVDQVDEWQARLKEIWEANVIVPIQLQYQSSRRQQQETWIVYPVCIYYVQRAIYLCAWGVVSESGQIVWHNFRLDNIQDLFPLKWETGSIPKGLREAKRQEQLPTPDEIQAQMAEAWGFDFYQPAQRMVLRFERWFDRGYVRNTIRHETFQPVSYKAVQDLIAKEAKNSTQRQELLEHLSQRSPQDAYYQVDYRHNDPNVLLRLRAWRPKLEVFLPWTLRQQMIEEARKELLLYGLQHES